MIKNVDKKTHETTKLVLRNATPEDIENLEAICQDIKVAMLTTKSGSGELSSRPMMTRTFSRETGAIWFFASSDSLKTQELETNPSVNVSYSCPKSNSYASLSGMARVVTDKEKIDQLWNPAMSVWFKEGRDDPTLCLIRVHVQDVEIWDGSSSNLMSLFKLAKAAVKNDPQEFEEDHERFKMS